MRTCSSAHLCLRCCRPVAYLHGDVGGVLAAGVAGQARKEALGLGVQLVVPG
ncbi:hypothetical protein N566_18905 [Streptomycetaceae bacterium MP113-05]|nr:hypothetical protein N566_18905 [Streptomycetaceae bacterium MP113-05]